MPFISTTLGIRSAPRKTPSFFRRRVEAVVRAVIPAANPDFDKLFPSVTLWWIEIDTQGIPQREIGFNSSGEPIVIAPFGENFGYWTDSPMSFAVSEHEAVSSQAFQTMWSQFESDWGSRAKNDV
jgi:hypothetical protein